ncbi:haloacid dehalogenase-like hydrolase [Vibrio vulnificus]|uniref:haloacid dehalogenase-like hydrolase n=2 Tax=Vibrio vulnificus TaxID=672 RepID=UPI001CDCE7E8|nr:HAD family hydrolase [Vibrio vulnificus]MCA4020529.1 haloacid dehalogenase-like hydrolase [Vibrio vulnificus]
MNPFNHGWTPDSVWPRIQKQVESWCDPSLPYFFPQDKRVAVFDLDGTLWCEKPGINELAFWRSELINALTLPQHQQHHPSISSLINSVQPASQHDNPVLLAEQYASLFRRVFSDITVEAYQQKVKIWLSETRHPRFQVSYQQLFYTPMLALMDYLRRHNFRCVINSGSTTAFVQAWCQPWLAINEEDVIGSQIGLFDEPHSFVINIGPEKVKQLKAKFAIKPLMAFGNTLGDAEQLHYVLEGDDRAIACCIHHDDSNREYSYAFDPLFKLELKTRLQRVEIVSIRDHWCEIFAFENPVKKERIPFAI